MRRGLFLCFPLLAILGACRRPAPEPPPHVVLVTIDTLRADHLGFAGYARDTSPHLDALAKKGVAFTRCYSASATTGAAHASLFTSRLPGSHGVLANRERFPDLPTLMSALEARGYRTAGFVSSVVLGRKSGLQDHFDHFDDELTTRELNRSGRFERPARATVAAALEFLDHHPKDRPLFLWMHLIDPHGPYRAPEDPDRYVGDALALRPGPAPLALGSSDWVFGQIPAYQALEGRGDPRFYVARYDAEIRYADAALGTFFARLEDLGLWDRSLVVVTADHGETLVEPGHKRYFAHGTVAYEETVRIPLLIREAFARRRLQAVARDAPVSSLDVAPTVLGLLGVPSPAGFEGRNLLGERRSDDASAERTVNNERRGIHSRGADDAATLSLGAYGSEQLEKRIGTQWTVLREPWRYVRNSLDGSEELYDHRGDPTEATNVAAAQPAVVAALRAELDRYFAHGRASSVPVEMTPEHAEALKALGYTQ